MNSYQNGKFLESELEKAIIQLFEQQGYTYEDGLELNRREDEILLKSDLMEFLCREHADEKLTENELERIITHLELIHSTPLYDGNRETFQLINEGLIFQRDDSSKPAIHIRFIDFENTSKNTFKIINQYQIQGERLRRPDLLVFINGIPVAIWEIKSAIKEDATIYDAWKQITIRYTRDIPALMKYTFLSVISDGANTKMGSIFTAYPYYYSWKKINDTETVANGIHSLKTMIQGAFTQERILAILRDFIFYPDNRKEQKAIVCRYPQYFAAQKILKNILTHMRPEGDGKGGTYFGATGCGKTYTMLFLSRLLNQHFREKLHNPTIVVLTDREDLDTQTTELFCTAKQYLHENDVRSIESRNDLYNTLHEKPSGGVYITTIQKFCETTGLLSDRTNIICISDEAHRTQTSLELKTKRDENGGLIFYWGIAKHLRDSFPNATYCGFTGTPVDETMQVFGEIVDSYTMREACDDGITVRISYEPRLARVLLSEGQAKEITDLYHQWEADGANPNQIEKSKREMSHLKEILGHPGRLEKLAEDIVRHYDALCAEKPEIVQKAMIVCTDRIIAFDLLKQILAIRPDWGMERRSEDDTLLTDVQKEKLVPLRKINLVATRDKDDVSELYDACGSKEYRKMLDKQFKNVDSNFKVAIVVDMWTTGFDVPSLAVMYIDKPLQQHTLIQTISRVNRVFDNKDHGLVVDYIGIKDDLLAALKQYGTAIESPVDELNFSLGTFRDHLDLLDGLFQEFDSSLFLTGTPLQRLECLNTAVEFIQQLQDRQRRFMLLSHKMKVAYEICVPSGELSFDEMKKAQFYLAVRSIIFKQTIGNTPDSEVMNRTIEEMVRRAIVCTGIENIMQDVEPEDILGENFAKQMECIKLPISKFNALLKLLRKAITRYGKTNKVKALEFDERLQRVVNQYNTRDNLKFTVGVIDDFVDELSDKLVEILNDLQMDQNSFKELGITYEEKSFYDILIKVRNDHNFIYEESRCLDLAKKIRELIDMKIHFANWATREDIKNELKRDLIVLLHEHQYPPEWNTEVFEQVLEQAENFKKYEEF